MRVSSRANKGQFTSVRFGKEPKPAAKPRQPRQPRQPGLVFFFSISSAVLSIKDAFGP